MSRPQWKALHHDLVKNRDTLAVEILPNGLRSYFMARAGKSVDPRSVKALLARELLKPCGIQIDPEVPQSYEPVV